MLCKQSQNWNKMHGKIELNNPRYVLNFAEAKHK